MKKILFALLLSPLLSFSSLATDTQPVNTSGSDNTSTNSHDCLRMPTACGIKI
jgi:hypothetical protein